MSEQLPLFSVATDPAFPPPVGATVILLPAAIESVRQMGSRMETQVDKVYIPGLDFPIPIHREMAAGEAGQVVAHEPRPDPFRGEVMTIRIIWHNGGSQVMDDEEFYRRRRWYRFY